MFFSSFRFLGLTRHPARRGRSFRSRSLRARISFFFLGLLLMGVGLFLAMEKTSALRIHAIRVEGASYLDANELKKRSQELLTVPVLGPVRGNFLLLPKERTIRKLHEEYPRIERIDIQRRLLHREIRIALVERTQVGIYCQAQKNAPVQNENVQGTGFFLRGPCFLIDRQGVIFAEAPQTEGGLVLSIIDSASDSMPALGGEAIEPARLNAIKTIWENFPRETRVGIRRVFNDKNSLVRIQTSEGWEALFDLTRDPQEQLVALRELLAKELSVQKRAGITTIDLRVPGKIYYR